MYELGQDTLLLGLPGLLEFFPVFFSFGSSDVKWNQRIRVVKLPLFCP